MPWALASAEAFSRTCFVCCRTSSCILAVRARPHTAPFSGLYVGVTTATMTNSRAYAFASRTAYSNARSDHGLPSVATKIRLSGPSLMMPPSLRRLCPPKLGYHRRVALDHDSGDLCLRQIDGALPAHPAVAADEWMAAHVSYHLPYRWSPPITGPCPRPPECARAMPRRLVRRGHQPVARREARSSPMRGPQDVQNLAKFCWGTR